MTPRLKERYLTEIAPRLREQFKFKNVMEAPKLEKIVVNMGVADAHVHHDLFEFRRRDPGPAHA